jgi:protein TonB
LALLLHALAFGAIFWIAARPNVSEPPPIPIEWLIEEEGAASAPAPGEPAALEPPRVRPTPPPRPATPRRVDRPRVAAPPRAPAPAPGALIAEPHRASPPVTTPGESATPPSGPIVERPHAGAGRVFGEGEVDAVAAPLAAIEARYPAPEQRLGREGVVVLDVLVEADGRVRDARVVKSGGDGFDDAAREAVVESPFRAARRAGEDVASRVKVRVHFELD